MTPLRKAIALWTTIPERTVTYSQDFLRIILTLCYALIKQFKLGNSRTKT